MSGVPTRFDGDKTSGRSLAFSHVRLHVSDDQSSLKQGTIATRGRRCSLAIHLDETICTTRGEFEEKILAGAPELIELMVLFAFLTS